MEAPPNLLKSAARLQDLLGAAGIKSIAVGGLAVAVWGEPRVTRDVDFKVLLGRENADQLLSSLPSDYTYLSREPGESLKRLGFLFIEDDSGIRIELVAC